MKENTMRRGWSRTTLALVSLSLLVAVAADATPKLKRAFATQYPAAAGSAIDACTTCHTKGKELNVYGVALQKAGSKFDAVEKDDSDADGVANLAEIKAKTNPGKADAKAAPDSSAAGTDSTAAQPDSGAASPPDSTAPAPPDSSKS
jgi:hypothetical protein